MKLLLEEIHSIPGIIGSFVFNGRQHILASDLPSVFKEQKLVRIGRMMMKLFSTSRNNFPDVSELSLFYEESHVIVREIESATYVIVLCTPAVNLNLLTMSLNLIMEDSEVYTSDAAQNSAAVETPPLTLEPDLKSAPEKYQSVSPKALIEEGPLAETLTGMQKSLAKVTGPMAKIIFEEAVEEWSRTTSPSKETLSELVDILKNEIEDPEKISLYEKLIHPYIAQRNNRRNLWRGGARHIDN